MTAWAMRVACALGLVLAAVGPALARPPQAEVVAAIQVHGNNVTSEADILAIAGVAVGDPFTEATPVDVRQRLVSSGRFETADVLQRFASISDATRIALVIIVDEHPVSIRLPGVPESIDPAAAPDIVRRRGPANVMWLPLLEVEDGYGFSYGAMVAWPGVAGDRSRLAVPLTWGGRRQAGVEIDRTFTSGLLSRVRAGAGVSRHTNPAFDEHDTRRRVWARADRRLAGPLWAAAHAALDDVTFADESERLASAGIDITLDTRLDPGLPRNAVFARLGWTRLDGDRSGVAHVTTVDLRGYVGLVRQVVLIARAEHDGADRARPRYLAPLLGGWSNLRGFKAGAFAGDTRTTGTLELRLPTSSPLSVAKAGVSVFVDAGKVYDRGVRFSRAPWRVGAGAGVWLSATVVQMGVSVAHGRGSGTRANVSVDLTF